MKLKRLVAISLIVCGVSIVILLVVGLMFSTGTLDRWSHNKTPSAVRPGDVSLSGQGDVQAQSGQGQQSGGSSNGSGNSSGGSSSTGSTSSNTSTKPSGGTAAGSGTGTGGTGGGSGGTGGGTTSASISSFAASPASVSYNSASTLTWASANAASCSISGLGAVGASGSKSTGNLTSSTTYTLTCGTASKQASVTVGSAPPSCGQSGGSCTAAQVAGHASQSDCWVIYNGYYYIVTSYIPNHPGGRSVFSSTTCGHDITSYLNGSAGSSRHNHSSGAYSTLNSYRIGQVQG